MLTFKRIWRLMIGSRLLYAVAVLAAALSTLFSLVSPLVMKISVDSVLNNEPIDAPVFVIDLINNLGGTSYLAQNLWICSFVIIFFTSLNGLFAFIRGRSLAFASENIALKLKNNLYDHLQKLPYDYHIKAKTGDLIQRCTSDVETIRRFLAGQVVELIRTVFIAAISITIMVNLNGKLTIAAVIMIPPIFIFSFVYFSKIRKTFKQVDEKEGELSAVLQENLSGVRVVRAFGRQKYETEKYEKHNAEFRDLGMKLNYLFAVFWSSSDFMCFTQIGIVLIAGVFMALRNEISLGTLMVFSTYESMMIWPIRHMGRILSDMGKMGVSAGRVYEILNTPEETDTEGAVKSSLKGDIVFDNVCFEYEKDNAVLKNMSFTIKSGETIAVLGTTGSGKSTVMHLLLRLYDYKSGSVKINGTELRNIEKKWLREKIGIVLQEPFLYSKTIRENIKMAKFNANDEEITDVTKTASIHSDIEAFEKGYDTMVGEKGVTLSGGQKQRVAIARTLIKNSQLLIFDDSLSAVDTETDKKIRSALKEKSGDTTTFIISQRITTLMEADRIFVIEDGVLTAQGSHDELVATDGLYSRIWNIQNMLEDDFEEEVS